MAKQMRNLERAKDKFIRRAVPLVEAAMEEGHLSRTNIAQATGIKIWELGQLFKDVPELYAKYTLRRRSLVDSAADNIQEIVLNKDHPKNYEASKYVLNSYKSDLDHILDVKDDALTVKANGMRSSRVSINFKK